MSQQLGIGTMLHLISGGSDNDPREFYGKEIAAAKLDEEAGDGGAILVDFADGTKISIEDSGRSCCESRYVRTDDNLQSVVGGKLQAISTKSVDGPVVDYGDHEQVFLELETTKGSVVFSFHNEHNGYYGGFGLNIVKRT